MHVARAHYLHVTWHKRFVCWLDELDCREVVTKGTLTPVSESIFSHFQKKFSTFLSMMTLPFLHSLLCTSIFHLLRYTITIILTDIKKIDFVIQTLIYIYSDMMWFYRAQFSHLKRQKFEYHRNSHVNSKYSKFIRIGNGWFMSKLKWNSPRSHKSVRGCAKSSMQALLFRHFNVFQCVCK